MRNVLVGVLCLLFVGCAPSVVIMLDGRPVPEYAYVLSNPETGIEVQVVAARWYYTYEGKEKILWPEYLQVDEIQKVDPDNTAFIGFDIKIKNLKKANYELVDKYSSETIINKGEKEITESGIYKGSLRHNKINIRHLVKEGTLTESTIIIKNGEGMQIMKIGSFFCKAVRPDSTFEERGDAN